MAKESTHQKHKDSRKSEKHSSKSSRKEAKHSSKKDSKDKKHMKEPKRGKEASSKKSGSKSEAELVDGSRIGPDDYFSKSEEFRVWLKTARSINFEDLSSKESRRLFEKEFVKEFNRGRLDPMYYTDGGIPLQLREATVKSQHKWGFKLSADDSIKLQDVAEDVNHQTRTVVVPPQNSSTTSAAERMGKSSSSGAAITAAATSTSSSSHSRGSAAFSKAKMLDRRSINAIAEEVLPEKAPAGSHERRMDQRRAAGAAVHAAHRFREEDRDGLGGLDEGLVMGGDSKDDLRRMQNNSRQHQERRQHSNALRAKELLEKQQSRETAFMQKLGIDPNAVGATGRIQIRPRED